MIRNAVLPAIHARRNKENAHALCVMSQSCHSLASLSSIGRGRQCYDCVPLGARNVVEIISSLLFNKC